MDQAHSRGSIRARHSPWGKCVGVETSGADEKAGQRRPARLMLWVPRPGRREVVRSRSLLGGRSWEDTDGGAPLSSSEAAVRT
jgi:hypothetical protein